VAKPNSFLPSVRVTVNDRDHLDRFLSAIDASPTALERLVCRGWIGDYQITGKRGHVLAAQPGYLLYANSPEGDETHPDSPDRSFWPKRAPPGLH